MTPETVGRFAGPVNIALVIALAYTLARLTWSLLPAPTLAPTLSPPETTGETSAATPTAPQYAAIAEWHLFGQVDTAKAVATTPSVAPETRLNLRLVGVFFAADETRAKALIAEGNGEESSYAVGKIVPGGARLTRILRDRVILSRDGVLETLSLPKESVDGATTVTPLPAATPPVADAAAGGVQHTVNASAIANRLRGAAPNNRPDALRDLALATPHTQNGQFIGFRLGPGRDRQLLGQLGLRPGDVITAVNGTRIANPGQGLNLIQNLANADQVNLQVLRDGTEIPFTFTLNDGNAQP